MTRSGTWPDLRTAARGRAVRSRGRALRGPCATRVVLRHEAAVALLEREAGVSLPIGVVEGGELRARRGFQQVDGIGPRRRPRQRADIAADAHQPLGLDHRADVVEHGAAQQGGTRRCGDHDVQAAARGADKDRRMRSRQRSARREYRRSRP